MSAAVSDSIVVDAPAEDVWDVIGDFEAYPQWQDEVREAEILETGEDGWATKVRLVVDAGILRAVLVLAYTYTDEEMHWELVEGDGVRVNTGTYRLEPREDGSTLVRYELEVEPSVPVPALLRRKAAQRIIRGALADMKRRVEAGA